MAVVEKRLAGGNAHAVAQEFLQEFHQIADWWVANAQDSENGGFWGEVTFDNTPNRTAQKGVILNARILWFFSEAAEFSGRSDYADAAHLAYQYFIERFVDRGHGGVFWMLDAQGQVIDSRKHTYAQSFAIYALSAYYRFSGDVHALDQALACFDLLQRHAADPIHNGYFEACSRDWGPLADIRLSEKEDNSPKTMNTNLHVLEAFTGLCNAMPFSDMRKMEVVAALANILAVYCERIVNLETGHLRMFMDVDWTDHSHAYSFGHDIESSWLIHKAIKALQSYEPGAARYLEHVKRLAEVALTDGLMPDGSLGDEYELASGQFSRSSWWVQAEAIVGFANMWAMGEEEKYLNAALDVWKHVQLHYKDDEHGEWFWYSKQEVPPEKSEYKIGSWKAPYHNGRAMLMMYQLLT